MTEIIWSVAGNRCRGAWCPVASNDGQRGLRGAVVNKIRRLALTAVLLAISPLGSPAQASSSAADSGAIAAKHRSVGGNEGYLGKPVRDVQCGLLQGGCAQGFQRGHIYWASATGARIARGGIGNHYAHLGRETSYLGYPVNDERCGLKEGGCVQSFQGGYIYWSPATGAHTLRGAIAATWAKLGWERGKLGYPLTAERCGLVAKGCVQSFQGGHIYWASASGAHAVWGAIGTKWARMGWENSPLGYPRTAESCAAGSCVQSFLGGTIKWTSSGRISVLPRQGSIGVMVNRRNPVSPVSRVPQDLVTVENQSLRREAAIQLRRLFSAAAYAGARMTAVSGYRSYASQSSLYTSYVYAYGLSYADTISARPGYSEHQSGLAVDIGNPNSACGLQACFAGTPAGSYAAANGWKFGFIIRYPAGLSHVTGYAYEPWHLRYVGAKVAADMHARGVKTLEQYLGFAGAPTY